MTDEPGRPQRPRFPSPDPRPSRRTGVSGSEFAGVGLQFAMTIVAFMFAGIWLDKTLRTSPWLLIVCVFVGAAAGFFSIYRKLMSAQRRTDSTNK